MSERQWGTVREDYSHTGDAWNYFSHDQARSRAYRLCDARGRRPVYGGTETFQSDPHGRDHLLFYGYFHGDNGAGLGASHQTGWTGLVATVIQLFGVLDSQRALEVGKRAAFARGEAKS